MSKKLLIAIDVQNDFVKGGPLGYGYPEESNTEKLCAYVKRFDRESLDNLVLMTKDTHGDNFANTLEGKVLGVPHCRKGTEGWQTVNSNFGKTTNPKIEVMRLEEWADEVILKPTFGTFDLVKWIKNFEHQECEEVAEIQICGYDLAICVLANAVILRAAFPNKKIVVLKNLCGCIAKETFDAAETVLRCQQIEVADLIGA